MNDFINQLSNFSDPGTALDVVSVGLSLTIAAILSIIVAKVYQITYKGVSFSPSFMHTLVICAMVISAVMLIIGSNIARAFSLVGALSIIRFRNAVKDPRDVAYIFLTMGIGMACGTGFYWIGVVLTVVVSAVTIMMNFFEFGEHGLSEKILRIHTPETNNFESVFDDVLKAHVNSFSLVSAETSRMGTEMELTFSVRVKKEFSSEKLINDLAALNENLKIQIVGSNHLIDL